MMKIRTLIILMFCGLLLTSCSRSAKSDLYTIGFVQITENPLLDEARSALIATLQDSGLVDGRDIRIIYRNAQGEIANINLILQSFRSARVDMVITSGTPCMIAAAQAFRDIPVVFTVAFSPEQIGLTLSDSNVVGVYDPLDMEYFIEIIQTILPDCHRLGLPYNPAEANSRFAAERLAVECHKKNLIVEATMVASSNDLLQASQALARKNIDAFLVAADNTVALAFDALVRVSHANKIPIFITEPGEVRKGALTGMGISYANWGRESGALAASIIKGQTLTKPLIRPAVSKNIILNLKVARQLGLAFPPELLQKATEIIQ